MKKKYTLSEDGFQYDGSNKWFFSSAPKEALKLLKPRKEELFYGAKTMGWVLMILSALMAWA